MLSTFGRFLCRVSAWRILICDNFAVCLAGDVAQHWDIDDIGVVIDVSARHAYNCVFIGRKYEPHSDGFVVRGRGYDARIGVVMFA